MKTIQAPITPLKSSASPDRLCSAIGNNCSAVSTTKFLFRNKQDTGWVPRTSNSFRSKDKNFARIVNDKKPKKINLKIQKEINKLKEQAIAARKYHKHCAKKYSGLV